MDPIDTGYYFIQNIGNEGYIGPYNDSDSNGTSLYSYEIYSTTNNNNDWIQAYHLYQQSDGYCCLKSDENSKYITINGNNVVQENAHSSGTNQLWLVYETASGIYMIPKYDQDVSNQRRIAGDSLVNEDLFISTSVSVYSLWEFKEATAYGGAGTYNAVTYTSQTFLGKDETYRCCGYALNDENVWYGGNIPNITSHSDTMLNNVFSAIRTQIEEDLNRECRNVDETSLLKPNEYRIAMRIGYYSEEYKDVHYMKQLYDGTWAHKPGYLASEHKSASFNVGTGIWSTPINYNSMYQAIYPYSYQTPYYGFYNSNTIYFAVSISTYGG